MKKYLITLIVLASAALANSQWPLPRANAKFCINQTFHVRQLTKVVDHARGLGCEGLIVTPIGEGYYHVYSVTVYVGE